MSEQLLPRSYRRAVWRLTPKKQRPKWREGLPPPPILTVQNRHERRRAVALGKKEYRSGVWVRELGRNIRSFVKCRL